jgi:regulatory protein
MRRSTPASSPPAASLKARALRWLAQRDHSRHELRTKLLRAADGDDAPAQVDALLEQLSAQGWLDESRFVESRVHGRQARFGNRRIEHELRAHGLTLSAQAAARLRDSELTRARDVWRKKFGQCASDAAGRAKQMRFLSARGFSPDVVHKVVSADHDDESV